MHDIVQNQTQIDEFNDEAPRTWSEGENSMKAEKNKTGAWAIDLKKSGQKYLKRAPSVMGLT